MAINWGLTVGLLVLNVLSVSGASSTVTPSNAMTSIVVSTAATTNTITAVAPTITATAHGDKTSIAPTPTISVQPTATQGLKGPSITYLKASFMVNSNCGEDMKGNLTEEIKKLFNDSQFDYKYVIFNSTNDLEGKCQVNITIMFGSLLKSKGIIDTFQRLTLGGGFKISEVTLAIQVPGVKLGDKFEPKEGDCVKTCCNGAGGPIALLKSCEPSNFCDNYKLEKTEPDCTKVCTCSGKMTIKISVMVMLLGIITNWLLN